MREYRPRDFWRFQFPALAWAAFIFVLFSIPTTVIRVSPPPGLDKVFHATIFFIFCLLLNRAFLNQNRSPYLAKHHVLVSLAIVVIYGILSELHQHMIPGRYPDYTDAIADAMGGVLCTYYLYVKEKVQTKRMLKSL